jgi:hypothetical protein
LRKKLGRMERTKRKVPSFKTDGIKDQFEFNEEVREWMTEKLRLALEEHCQDQVPDDL